MRFILGLSLLITACLSLPPGFAAAHEQTGFTLNQFRIIYSAAETKGVTWSMTNKTDRAYLMQSWMRQIDAETGLPAQETHNKASTTAIPFLVTPPLTRVDPGEALTLRIRLTELSLPADREAAFYLSVKGIPAISDSGDQGNGKVVIAVVNNIKLFYRPEGLPAGGVTQAATQLRFSRHGDSLIVDNPTPFYINFSQLRVGGKPLSAEALRRLLPPQGQLRYDLKAGMSGPVTWQVLDEDSHATPEQRQSL